MRKIAFTVVILILLTLVNYQYMHKDKNTMYSQWEAECLNKEQGDDQENDVHIYIDLNQTLLYVIEGDKVIKKYPISIGKDRSPSPIGIWRVVHKAKNWGSGFGSRWMGLDVPWGIYGIHGTNKPGSIGYAASHGCIRMNNNNVEELYDLIPHNTLVVINGGPYGNFGNGLRQLEPGHRGADVLEVQKRLKIKGYYDGPLDGRFGEGTKHSLIEYKKQNGLPINDHVDHQTYESLGIIIIE
ncbi:MAG: L,D-transpeptidase family protein [Clostridia bacterium]|nr:L,D-transpeptidase family protein [Clostridia bacterium]